MNSLLVVAKMLSSSGLEEALKLATWYVPPRGTPGDYITVWKNVTYHEDKGTIVGPPVSDGLKRNFGANNVATEGVNYAALLSTNFLPGGADPAGIALMANLLNRAATECPNSKIVAGGYR